MEETIRTALPYLEEDAFKQVTQHLDVLGVRKCGDLDLLNPENLCPVLTLVDSIRLLRAFRKGNVYIFAFSLVHRYVTSKALIN